jgi:hypothetical protein
MEDYGTYELVYMSRYIHASISKYTITIFVWRI